MLSGFIYILSNPSFGGLLKIGRSDFDPAKRKAELETTAVPDAFKIEYYAYVENHNKLEYKIHNALKEYRPKANREFFNCNIHLAIETIRRVSGQQLKYEENNVPEEKTITLSKIIGNKSTLKQDTILLDKIVDKQNQAEKDYSNLGFPLSSLFKYKNKNLKTAENKKDKPETINSINIIISLIIFSLIFFIGIFNNFSADAIVLSLLAWWVITFFYMMMTKTTGLLSMILILGSILFIYSNLDFLGK